MKLIFSRHLFSKKSYIVDVQPGSKYAFVMVDTKPFAGVLLNSFLSNFWKIHRKPPATEFVFSMAVNCTIVDL